MIRPLLPRASSATSGFFFCGMIELPVAKASSSSTQPNSLVVHSTSSSPTRGQVHADQGGDEEELRSEVAVAHGVDRIGRWCVEPELGSDRVGIER